MIKVASLSVFSLIIAIKAFTQNEALNYFKEHSYTITFDQPLSKELDQVFAKMASDSRIIFTGEGGSHFLSFYQPLEAYFVTNLNRVAGLKCFLMEMGSSTAFLCNKYLDTGDTTYLPRLRTKGAYDFWKYIYQYNQSVPRGKRIKVIGVDFESYSSYFKALNYLLPDVPAPQEIADEVALVKAKPAPANCDEMVKVDKLLKKSLKKYAATWENYTGKNFYDVYIIISNEGTCKDALRDRNKNFRRRFLAFDSVLKEPVYYAIFGQAHTTLADKSHFSALLNNDPRAGFYRKVSVINTFCHHCVTAVEPTSNWTIAKIEDDIQAELLPLTGSSFTLFDFASSPAFKTKYTLYGQFLLVVKDQQ